MNSTSTSGKTSDTKSSRWLSLRMTKNSLLVRCSIANTQPGGDQSPAHRCELRYGCASGYTGDIIPKMDAHAHRSSSVDWRVWVPFPLESVALSSCTDTPNGICTGRVDVQREQRANTLNEKPKSTTTAWRIPSPEQRRKHIFFSFLGCVIAIASSVDLTENTAKVLACVRVCGSSCHSIGNRAEASEQEATEKKNTETAAVSELHNWYFHEIGHSNWLHIIY